MSITTQNESGQKAAAAESGELLTPEQRLNIAEAVRKAFPHVDVPHNVYDQIAWNTEQACYAAASRQLVDAQALQVRAVEALKPLVGCPIVAGSQSDTVLIGSGNWKLTVGDIDRARQLAAVEPPSTRPGAASERGAISQAARDVLAERSRQVEAEGWTPANDDAHDDGAMARAAACYALPVPMLVLEERSQTYDRSRIRGESPIWATAKFSVPAMWPASWRPSWWKPKDRRRDLVRAGALILAEIERMDRAALASTAAPALGQTG